MSNLEPYNLVIKTSLKSKAKFLKFIPIKSFVEGEKYEISFKFQNRTEETFPGGELYFRISWPSQQEVRSHFSIPSLKRGETFETPKFVSEALSEGFGLIYITNTTAKDQKGHVHKVNVYSGERVENLIDTRASVSSAKTKSWEEIYEFWALIVAALSLAIIALEKIFSYLPEILKWLLK